MSDAANRLLAAPELIELILLELDHSTLLCRANRVSRQWYDIVALSPRIQSKLFFRPVNTRFASDGPAETIQDSQMWKRSWRLQDLFQAHDPNSKERQVQITSSKKPAEESAPPKQPTDDTTLHTIADPTKPSDTQAAFTRHGASWRRMLIQQPAVTCIGQVVVRRRLDGSVVTKVGKAQCPNGVRMGHVWDTLRESMVHLQSDMCLMRLVWWEPNLSAFEKALYPMADDVLRLFEEGAQVVVAVGFNECVPADRFCGKFEQEYDALCQCEDFEPLDFQAEEIVTPARPSRRRGQVA